MKSKIKKLLINSSLSLFSLLICLILAEYSLRQFFPLPLNQGLSYRIPHPKLGWSLKPNASRVRKTADGDVLVSYNSQGWRDVEHTLKKPDDVFRILVLGDSYMEAYTVNVEDAFHNKLQQLADAEGKRIELINMGVGGFGTLQEYLVFKEYGKDYQPDLVLLAFYLGNDLKNNYKAYYPLKNIPYLLKGKIVYGDYEKAQQRYAKQLALRKKSESRWWKKSLLIERLRFLFMPTKASTLDGKINPELVRTSICQQDDTLKGAWEVTKQLFFKLDSAVSETGSQLVIFSVPAMKEVDLALQQKILQEVAISEKYCLEEDQNYQILQNITTTLEVPYINLTPIFRQKSRLEKEQLFPIDDRHWNANGHELAATQVWKFLKEKRLIKQ